MFVRMTFKGGVSRGRRLMAAACLAVLVGMAATSTAAAIGATVKVKTMPVVASFSVLGDMVAEIGGDHIELTTIIGLGGDAHAFEPTPEHVRALSEARVLVINGLGFEAWLPRLLTASGFEGRQVVASKGVEPRVLGGAEQAASGHDSGQTKGARAGDQHGPGHHHGGGVDPHAWQSLTNGMIYVRNIAEGLAKADPANASVYFARASRYIDEMKKLDAEMRHALGQIAPERRKVVVPHDSLGYFGEDYGIKFVSIMGISGQAEASAHNVAAVVDQVRAAGSAAVFLESGTNPKLAEQIARETGVPVGGTLYADTLSESDQPAGTYLGMIKWNAGQLIYVLKPAR